MSHARRFFKLDCTARVVKKDVLMNLFDIAAILTAIAAVCGYLNHRWLRLPSSIGILAIALVSSLLVLAIDALTPQVSMRAAVVGFLLEIDFNEALMHGMLCFLLFAGALHVELEHLLSNKWSIGTLASIGILISTVAVAGLMYLVFGFLGMPVPFLVCLVFGALISPTDPIAVMGLLKDLSAPKDLEAKIAGESLFNDGVGVVVFLALAALAGLSGSDTHLHLDAAGVALFFLQEVGGGLVLGWVFGFIAYRALRSIDDYTVEVLITLGLVMFTYTLSFWLHVSGPIAVVVAGLFIGNHGKRFAMSERTTEHLDSFWHMTDEFMNAVLFLLLGLEVFAVRLGGLGLVAGLIAIPVVLLARFLAVSVPVSALRMQRQFKGGLIPILTWGGLRGGISVALVLSLPAFEHKNLLLTCTYAVVVFSVLVQGLSMRRLLMRFGVGTDGA